MSKKKAAGRCRPGSQRPARRRPAHSAPEKAGKSINYELSLDAERLKELAPQAAAFAMLLFKGEVKAHALLASAAKAIFRLTDAESASIAAISGWMGGGAPAQRQTGLMAAKGLLRQVLERNPSAFGPLSPIADMADAAIGKAIGEGLAGEEKQALLEEYAASPLLEQIWPLAFGAPLPDPQPEAEAAEGGGAPEAEAEAAEGGDAAEAEAEAAEGGGAPKAEAEAAEGGGAPKAEAEAAEEGSAPEAEAEPEMQEGAAQSGPGGAPGAYGEQSLEQEGEMQALPA
jgi:hypothetical protein